ncbi:MAG: hypothetical protein ACI88L_000576 [Candidatus Paceibacteria bacterium]|jgi:hypothetical protein
MDHQHSHHDWKKYIIVFLITAGIFLVAIYLSSSFSNKRFNQMRAFQDKLSTDILSSETRFALLERTSCEHFVDDALLSEELNLFGNRLNVMEKNLDKDDPAVEQLRRYYSLLQVKDYILVTQLAEKCGTEPVVLLYFHEKKCEECEAQEYILENVSKDFSGLNLYSFDYDTELSAVRTLISTLNVLEEELPTLIINGQTHKGGLKERELRDILSELTPEKDLVDTE